MAAGDINISCWVKSQEQGAVGTLSDCDCCRKFRKWVSTGCEGRWLALSHRPASRTPALFMSCFAFSSEFFCVSFAHCGRLQGVGSERAPPSGQFCEVIQAEEGMKEEEKSEKEGHKRDDGAETR